MDKLDAAFCKFNHEEVEVEFDTIKVFSLL